MAVAAALLTGSGTTPPGEPAVTPAAATAGAPAEPAAEPGHGAWTPGDPAQEWAQRWAQEWAQLPEELRQDLAALRTVPAAERLATLHRIRDDALAGAYGEEVRAGAQRLALGLAMLPPGLVADLEGLVSLEVAAMPDAVERIRDRALAGEYGEQVRAGAEQLVSLADRHGVDVRGDLDRLLPQD